MRASAEASDAVRLAGNLIGIVWLTAYALAAARGRAALQRLRVRAARDYFSGVVLVGLGVRLAFERG